MSNIYDSKRMEGETYKDYKKRLKENKKAIKEKLKAKVYWPGYGGTFTHEKAAEMARRILSQEADLVEAPDFESKEEEEKWVKEKLAEKEQTENERNT